MKDLTLSELFTKMQSDLERWDKKKEAAENALTEATSKLQELKQTIAGLRSYLPQEFHAVEPNAPIPSAPGEFTLISTRQAIKLVLERASGPLKTEQIAQELLNGGAKSSAESFRSNVSATLSVMQSKYHEVSRTPLGWILSQPSLSANSDKAA